MCLASRRKCLNRKDHLFRLRVCQIGITLGGYLSYTSACAPPPPPHDAVITGDNSVHISSGNKKDICSFLSSQMNKTVERSRNILQAIVDVIVLCGKQNFALRGRKEKNSNVLIFFQLSPKTDPVLAGLLNSNESRAIPKYTPRDVQNELIELCGDFICKLLLQDYNSVPSFALLAGEATDSGTKEQISICVRFVLRKEG